MAAAAQFDYRARDALGREHRGVAVGASSAAVAKELAGRGWVAVDIKATPGTRGKKTAERGFEAAAVPTPPRAANADDGTVASPALNLRLPRLGASFDVRFTKLGSRGETATLPSAKRTQMITMSVGISIQ